MRKKLFFLLLSVVICFCSCQSSVDITYMVPSEIDMGGHRNIAIASTVPYYGFSHPSRYIRAIDSLARYGFASARSTYDWSLKDEIADYMTDKIVSTLDESGYYTILPPDITDSILDASRIGVSSRSEFEKRGVDAVLIPRIDNMSIDEYIYSKTTYETRVDSDGNEYETADTRFYYDADYYLAFSYTIVDVESESIIATRRFVVEDDDNFLVSNPYLIYAYPDRHFERMVDSSMSRITRQLVPLRTRTSLTLMDNRPKSEDAQVAYDVLKDGDIKQASGLFWDIYLNSGHVPSGYNASLATAACGDIQKAMDMAKRVYDESGNAEVYQLYSRLKSIDESNKESMRQLSDRSGEESFSSPASGSIYDALRR